MEYCVTDADGYIHEHGTLLSVTDDNTLAYADDEFIYIFQFILDKQERF